MCKNVRVGLVRGHLPARELGEKFALSTGVEGFFHHDAGKRATLERIPAIELISLIEFVSLFER